MKRKHAGIKWMCVMVVCIGLFGSTLAVQAATTYYWQGQIDFWGTDLSTQRKTNHNNYTDVSFTGRSVSDLVNLYFSVYNNSAGAESSSQQLVANDTSRRLNSSALYGDSLTLKAHREYIFDTKILCSGTWTP